MFLSNVDVSNAKLDINKVVEQSGGLFEVVNNKLDVGENNYAKYIEDISEPIQKSLIDGFVKIEIELGWDDDYEGECVETYIITKKCLLYVDPVGKISNIMGESMECGVDVNRLKAYLRDMFEKEKERFLINYEQKIKNLEKSFNTKESK